MKSFNYYQPTEIIFGRGRFCEAGQAAARYGKRCLLVTVAEKPVFQPVFDKVKALLAEAGLEVAHFDGVVPNPTTDVVTAGADLAKSFGADVVMGLGGGSSMDTAKAIAVEATHPGTAWDYLFFKTPPTTKTLPIIAVSTTSGTGSQVTQVAVLTETASKTKSAIYNSIVYPRVAIVDPELMTSVPPHVTASTGWDVFCHSFESILHPGNSAYVTMMAMEAIWRVKEFLPLVVENGEDLDAREQMAWADTLAGLCIASAGVTLPHGIGMTIGGYAPQVMHGEALAVTYPEFTRHTHPYAIPQFAAVGRIFNPALSSASDEAAAEGACEALDNFLKRIGMWLSLEGLGVPEADVTVIADHSQDLPDYKNNPWLATRDEIYEILVKSYRR